MNNFEKGLLKILSYPTISLKKFYRVYRKVLEIVNPHFKPLYRMMDHRMLFDGREIPVRVFLPAKGRSDGALIFFHGGGWIAGNIDTYTGVCANMANKTNRMVISVDYRLAPEHPFPAGLEDCYFVAKECFFNPDLLKCSPEDIALIGDSAGGNLAAAVSLMAMDRGEFLPSSQILLYPSTYFDHSESSPFPSITENGNDYLMTSKRIRDYMDMYVQDKKYAASPYVAPMTAERPYPQPDTLIITAEYDPLRDEGEAYGKRLRKFGNYVKIYRINGALHGFFSFNIRTHFVEDSYRIINSFLTERRGKEEGSI